MCGIAGIYVRKSLSSPTHLRLMADALAHRGPDGESIEIRDHVGLVHRRLSIIDLETGRQPLTDEDGRLLIVNGEIYNYVELRKGFPLVHFRTQSDCEVILPLYKQQGLRFTESLRGMYGLALYDPLSRDLILARDLFGMKQLYYTQTPQGFIFASEPNAILATNLISAEVNPQARAELLQLRYNTGRTTIFNRIERLLPGETIIVRDGEIIAYHQETKCPSLNSRITPEEALFLLEQTFQDSVHLHLRSDVPYGLFLSGGLDSASLLAFMSRETGQRLKTYTIGFKGAKIHDERNQASRLAQHFKTDHTEVDFSEDDFWSLLPAVVEAHDDPVFDPAMIPTFKLAAVAKQDVKVILCGEGGDEMLAGYRRYQKAHWPSWLGGRLFRQKGVFDATPLKACLTPWREGIERIRDEAVIHAFSKVQTAQLTDLETWMPNNLLIKLDRCLMAHGLEGRTPYLDRVVLDHLFSLPDRYKIHHRQGKWILRQWLAKNLPEAEPFAKKRGFSVPVAQWMKVQAPHLARLVAQQPGIREFLPSEHVMDIFLKEKKNYPFAAWVLLVYAVWHQRHIMRIPRQDDTFSFLART